MSRQKVSLTPLEEKELKEQFRKSKDVRIRERCQAILLRNKGYKVKEIVDILDRSIATIKLWTKLYREGGIENLKPKPQPGNNRKLTKEQKDKINQDLDTKTPNDFGFDRRFWTVKLLKKHVRKKYSVVYKSERSYHALLKYCGFSVHRPTKKDRRQDEAKVKEFKEELKKNSGKPMMIPFYWQKMKQGSNMKHH